MSLSAVRFLKRSKLGVPLNVDKIACYVTLETFFSDFFSDFFFFFFALRCYLLNECVVMATITATKDETSSPHKQFDDTKNPDVALKERSTTTTSTSPPIMVHRRK